MHNKRISQTQTNSQILLYGTKFQQFRDKQDKSKTNITKLAKTIKTNKRK